MFLVTDALHLWTFIIENTEFIQDSKCLCSSKLLQSCKLPATEDCMCSVHKEDHDWQVKHALQLHSLQGSVLRRGSLPKASGWPQTSSLGPFGLLTNTPPIWATVCVAFITHTQTLFSLFFQAFTTCSPICSFLLFLYASPFCYLIRFYPGTAGVHVHQPNVKKGQMYSILLANWGRQICWFMLMSQRHVHHPSNIRCFLL